MVFARDWGSRCRANPKSAILSLDDWLFSSNDKPPERDLVGANSRLWGFRSLCIRNSGNGQTVQESPGHTHYLCTIFLLSRYWSPAAVERKCDM